MCAPHLSTQTQAASAHGVAATGNVYRFNPAMCRIYFMHAPARMCVAVCADECVCKRNSHVPHHRTAQHKRLRARIWSRAWLST